MIRVLILCCYLGIDQSVMSWPWTQEVESMLTPSDDELESENMTDPSPVACPVQLDTIDPKGSEPEWSVSSYTGLEVDNLMVLLVLILNVFVYWSIVLYAYLLYRQRNSERKQSMDLALSVVAKCETLVDRWITDRANLPMSCAMCASSSVNRGDTLAIPGLGVQDVSPGRTDGRSFFGKTDQSGPAAMYVAPG